jgi:hypothetical protein
LTNGFYQYTPPSLSSGTAEPDAVREKKDWAERF